MADNLPPTLYHYCSIQGFHGIVTERTVRLCQLSSMNDYLEHTWLRNVMRTEMWDPKCFDHRGVFGQYAAAILNAIKEETHNDPYCVSFSARRDDLYQWRAYADDGRGFAIGIATDNISERWYPRPPKGGFLGKVIYSAEEQREIARRLIAEVREIMRREVPEGRDPQKLKEIAQAFIREKVDEISVLCKNPQFALEDEWRLVINPDEGHETIGEERQFYIRGASLIHYLTKAIDHVFAGPKMFAEFWLGPKNPAINNRKGLNLFLKKTGCSKVPVHVSSASYR